MTKLNEFTQLLRDRLPLSVVIARFVAIKKKGREYSGLCPFHEEKGASFTVNDDKGFYHCFGCGAHGDLFNFVMQKMNLPFMEAVEYLAQQANLSVPQLESAKVNSEAKEAQQSLYQVMEMACQWFESQLRHSQAESVRQYLMKRGMIGATAKKFRVGYAPEAGLKEFLLKAGCIESQLIQLGLIIQSEKNTRTYDRFRSRVMFPIQDVKGRVIAFGGRIIEQGEPKYLNSPDTPLFHKGRQLYALNHSLSKARSGQPFVVVEGYMDVISLHQNGIETAVAPLGTALTPDQLQLLWRTSPTPILCFDGDTAGIRAAERVAQKALEVITPGYSLSFCFLSDGEDPDSYIKQYGTSVFQQLLGAAKPLIEVLWNDFIAKQDLSTPEKKAKARKEILGLTNQIRDPDIQHFYRQDFNSRLQNFLQSQWNKNGRSYVPTASLVTKKLTLTKKNADGQKILLATLLNHPTLVSQVSEQLMDLTFADGSLNDLRQKLLDICGENPHIEVISLKEQLQQAGFGATLDQLLCRDVYHKARFAHPTTDLQQAQSGWLEIWTAMQEVHNLKQEVTQTAAELSSSLDEQVWQRLKLLKKTLVVRKTN
ncbi:DNA primase [Candidatus Paracaedibacter symbiosus]|uniref:DNA primase n=1 Tax=Candidatus Paracaedibacter symbiosus TaxID=244582 RepID=UPI000509F750|nr:DNA primase [Candidatus Paracaedibacter symbiosus]